MIYTREKASFVSIKIGMTYRETNAFVGMSNDQGTK